MSKLAIIPARGGSKRIPRKNIKDFLGKPIIAYSIEAALQSGLFDEVMVSTDDHEIAEIAIKYGAKVPFFRSQENSNDYATTMAVIQEVITKYNENSNALVNLVCCIYPTAPLIQIKHLIEGCSMLNEKNLDSVYPVVAFGYPIWRGVEILDNGKAQMIWPEYLNSRSQDLKKVYHDAGQWYWMNMSYIYDNTILKKNIGTLVMTELEVQDIDNETDWKIAELKYKLLVNNGKII